jgi:hypothetical protein
MRRSPLLIVVSLVLAGCSSSAAGSHPTATPRPTTAGLVYAFPTATPGGKKRATAVPGATLPAPPALQTSTPAVPVHPPATSYTATLYGSVSDRKSHKPIPNALVSVADGQKTAHTSSSGAYRIAFPGGVTTAVQVRKKGYQCGLAMGTVKSGKSLKADWKCDKLVPGHPIPPPFPAIIGTPAAGPPPGGPPKSS